jgi:hypothetical protein
MSDSIVYDHNSIQFDSNGFTSPYRLVKYNGQTISIGISSENYNKKSIIIKNLDTGNKLIEWIISPNRANLNTYYSDVFMYSNSILWIGLSGNYGNYFAFSFDFISGELKDISSRLKNFTIREIIPVGQKYFMLCPLNNLLNIENLSLIHI